MSIPETRGSSAIILPAQEELIDKITPNQFVSIYLAVRGYALDESSEMQHVPRRIVEAELRGAASNLGAKTLEQAAAISLYTGLLPDPAQQEHELAPANVELTNAEVTALELAMSGLAAHQIAGYVKPFRHTLTYTKLYRKLNARNTTQAIWRGFQVELFRPMRT